MEFEIEPKESYYRTYSDRIITGSIFENQRGLIGSSVGTNYEYQNTRYYSDYLRKGLFEYVNHGAFSPRLTPVLESSKFFFDSIMPDFASIYRLNGGVFIAPTFDAWSWETYHSNDPKIKLDAPLLKIMLMKGTGNNVTGSSDISNKKLGDELWQYHYPFQSRYKTIPRLQNNSIDYTTFRQTENSSVQIEFKTTDGYLAYGPNPIVSGRTIITSSKDYVVSIVQGTMSDIKTNTYYDRIYDPAVYLFEEVIGTTLIKKNLSALKQKDLMSIFYGINVENISRVRFSTDDINNGTVYRYFGNKIQGWKYGVWSGLPTNPKVIFRTGKYGQFRDMLEQRPFTKIFDPKTNTFDNPILISFVTGSKAWVTASNPESLNPMDSGMYDFEYKCGKPFIEGEQYSL